MADTYESQLKFIARRAQEVGLDRAELNKVYSAKHSELLVEFPDRSDAWRLSRVEYHLWQKFFPKEPNPIILVHIAEPTVLPFLPPVPAASSSKRSNPFPNLSKREWVHDKFDPDTPRSSHKTVTRPRAVTHSREIAVAHPSTDRYRGEAYPRNKPHTEVVRQPIAVTGDSYRPRSGTPRAKPETPPPGKSMVAASSTRTAPSGPKAWRELTQSEVVAWDAQNPSRLSRSEGLAGLGMVRLDYEAQAQSTHTIAPSGPNARRRLIPAEMAAYDAQNPTLLSSGVEEKPTVPAKLKKENEDLSSRSISQPKMEIDRTSLNPAAGSRRLYVGNFAYTTTERDLTSLFRRYSIESITMPQDRVTNRPAGYAFIEISTAQEAECAIDEFSNKRFGDRRLTVQFAMPDPAQASSTSSNKLRSALVSNNYVQSRQVISSGRPIDQPVSSMVVNSTPASSDTHRPDPAWDEFYANQEGVMELRAIKGNFRHDFFLFLQKARDLARQTHPLCSRPIRGYLADKLTWKHFFRDPFPGIEPRKGHTEACLAARRNIPSSKGYSSGRPVDRDRSAGPAPRVVGGSPTVKAEPMTNSQRKMAHMGDVARITHGLPLLSDGDSIMADAVRNLAVQSSATFKDPEQYFKAYKETLDLPDANFTAAEQEVKAQGNLRLVLDEDSGQMVTVGELIKRIKYRCTLKAKREAAEVETEENMPTQKRKSDEEAEQERAQKKMRNFLDSFEQNYAV